MANAVYPKFRHSQCVSDSDISLTGSGSTGVWAALINTASYSYNAAHQFYSDLGGVGATIELTNPTLVNALLDADDATFLSVAGTVSYEAIVLFRKNGGANTTWRLIAYLDAGVTGLPVTSNGGNIAVTPNAAGLIQF